MTKRMVEVLKLLACSASEQQAALPDFVVVPDEVALLFDDEFRLVEVATDPPVIRDGLLFIEDQLSKMSSDRSLWNMDAMKASPAWQQLRVAAQALLSALGIPAGPPDLSWGTYVRGAPSD